MVEIGTEICCQWKPPSPSVTWCNRTGPTGKARLAFIKHHTRFANMAKGV